MRSRCRGFTLIEVMVALTIVALSLTAVGASVSQMIDAANTLRERTYASWIAQNRIAESRLALQAPEVSTTSGDVTFANAEWRWRSVVTETGVEELYRIDVSVSLADNEEIIRTVTGFVGTPGIAGVANQVFLGQVPSSTNVRNREDVGPLTPER